MIEVREFETYGQAEIGWLSARHHFSFAEYVDPDRMNWGVLRVWNDDTIQPDTGFERHGHRDMEIITYVRKGAITHRDHLGNEGRTEAGDVQAMSAGSGILHEEFNLEDTTTEIFQIWITPSQAGGDPYWRAGRFPAGDSANRLTVLASGRIGLSQDALPIRQDATLFGMFITPGGTVTLDLDANRMAYAVSAAGAVEINGHQIGERSSAAIQGERKLVFSVPQNTDRPAEILLVDLPPSGD